MSPPVSPETTLTPAPTATPGRPMGLYAVGVLAVVLAGGGVLTLSVRKQGAEAREAATRKADVAAGPRVRVVPVSVAPAERTVTLPGEVRAFNQSTLYAKVSGYLKDIRVDKGDKVQKGQLLATLESPDTDQQVTAAEADLALRQQTAQRDEALIKTGVVSQQEVEQAQAAVKVAAAALARARALQAYEEIRAPFSGVITRRYVDPGALLPAATGSTQAAQPVVDIADMDRLRVFVYLGQDDAALVREGDEATVTMDQRPGEALTTKVARLSRSLDPRTRTMLCELDLDNAKAGIYPGEFVHVGIKLRARPYPMIPSEALIARGDKLRVAVVRDGRAHLVPVQVGQDDGRSVQIVSGLSGGEQVAINAAGELEDGAPVQPVTAAATTR